MNAASVDSLVCTHIVCETRIVADFMENNVYIHSETKIDGNDAILGPTNMVGRSKYRNMLLSEHFDLKSC